MDSQEFIQYAAIAAEKAANASALFMRAIAAANNGDQAAADAYLADARGRWDEADQVWEDAPGPGEEPAPEPPAEPT